MEPEITELTDDIKTLYAETFDVPKGIPAVFDELAKQVPGMNNHHLYGVTACLGDRLTYRACLQQMQKNEGEKYHLPSYNIPKGKYLYIILHNWQQHLTEIAGLFDNLMQLPDVKKDSICLEDYRSPTELWLMVAHK